MNCYVIFLTKMTYFYGTYENYVTKKVKYEITIGNKEHRIPIRQNEHRCRKTKQLFINMYTLKIANVIKIRNIKRVRKYKKNKVYSTRWKISLGKKINGNEGEVWK